MARGSGVGRWGPTSDRAWRGAGAPAIQEKPPAIQTMICKVCGTEIADKALICYRCGTSTFEPTRRERPKRRRRVSPLPSVIALIVIVVAALFMGRAAIGAMPRTIGIVLLALAVFALVLQLLIRRRR